MKKSITINNHTYTLIGDKTMKPVYAITEEQALLEMKQNWIQKDPEVQARVRVSAAEVVEASQISWRAGFQAGLMSAIMTIKQVNEEVAKELMLAFKGEEMALPEQKPIPMVKTVDIPKAH